MQRTGPYFSGVASHAPRIAAALLYSSCSFPTALPTSVQYSSGDGPSPAAERTGDAGRAADGGLQPQRRRGGAVPLSAPRRGLVLEGGRPWGRLRLDYVTFVGLEGSDALEGRGPRRRPQRRLGRRLEEVAKAVGGAVTVGYKCR